MSLSVLILGVAISAYITRNMFSEKEEGSSKWAYRLLLINTGAVLLPEALSLVFGIWQIGSTARLAVSIVFLIEIAKITFGNMKGKYTGKRDTRKLAAMDIMLLAQIVANFYN
jgi:hypothetical protein